MIKSIASTLLIALTLGSQQSIGKEASQEFVGKKWHELPKSAYGGFTLPLDWSGDKKFSLRYYNSEFGKEVITIVEIMDSKDPSQDLIVAALDLRTQTSSTEKEIITGTNDCQLKGNSEKESLVIGTIKQNRDKPIAKYKPIRAWLIKHADMHFSEVPAKKVVCIPQSYAN